MKKFLSMTVITFIIITMFMYSSFADSSGVMINNISDKKPGDTLTISGTSALDEISIKIITPDSTILYISVVDGPSFSDTITLPADAKKGIYTVVAGKGKIVATTTFRVVSEDTVIPVTGVQLNRNKLSLTVGSAETLIATVIPSNATNKNVTWTSSNTGIAVIDSTGKVTAVSAGTAIITVTTEDGKYTATCKVTVSSGSSGGAIPVPISDSEPEPEPAPETEAEPKPIKKPFNDIGDYPWAKEAVESLSAKGIIKGTSETTFEPGKNIIRADFILLLVRALDLKADFSSNFDDVSPDSYYYEALGIARALGIAKGTGGNLFNPKAEITREDMMVLTARALRIAGKLDTVGIFEDIKHFDDADEVSGYAVESVAALVKEGIIKGDRKSINPKGTATRAEAATVIYRIYQLLNMSEE